MNVYPHGLADFKSSGKHKMVRYCLRKCRPTRILQSFGRPALVLCLFTFVFPVIYGTVYSAQQGSPKIEVGAKKIHSQKTILGVLVAAKRPHISDPFGEIDKAEVPDSRAKRDDITQLMKQLEHPNTGENDKSTKFSAVNKSVQQEIERVLKRAIALRPDDIHILDPVFAAATGGTLNQRKAAIEILGSLKEPLAEPLLAGIAKDPGNPLRDVAARGLRLIRSKAIVSCESLRIRYFQVFLLAASILLACGVAVAGVRELRIQGNRWQAILMLLCVLLTAWLFGIIASDYLLSGVTDKDIDDAVQQKHLLAVAKKINMDLSYYPGDSYATRRLVLKADPDIIPLLTQIRNETSSSIRYQDYWARHLKQRIDWITARLKQVKTGHPGSSGLPRHAPPK